MPHNTPEKALAYRKKYEAENKERLAEYTKRYNKANNNAKRLLIELYKNEYEIILAGEKRKLGIEQRSTKGLW